MTPQGYFSCRVLQSFFPWSSHGLTNGLRWAVLAIIPLLANCQKVHAQTNTADSHSCLSSRWSEIVPACFDSTSSSTSATPANGGAIPSPQQSDQPNDWLSKWLRMVDKTRTKQPHYVAPLITPHVLLVQQFRFDSYYQQASPRGFETDEYGAMKGLEIIANPRLEMQIGIPPYFYRQDPTMPDGFGDVSIFLKFRAFSAPEEHGDYFVGFFLAGEFPTAALPNGLGHTIWSPMLAAAKGWGRFDVQSVLGGNLPQSGTAILGRQILFNNTFQFHVLGKFWPELETNTTFYVQGPHNGNQSTYLTPGLLIGPFKIARRLHFVLGAGFQTAVSSFYVYNHRWIWSVRFPF